MRKLGLAILIVLAAVGSVSAQTITTNIYKVDPMTRITWAYVTSTNGDAVGAVKFGGLLYRIGFTPTAPMPTALYDVAATDADGFDCLLGLGANLASNTAVNFYAQTNGLPLAVEGSLRICVTNAGPSKAGTVTLWFR